MYKPEPHRLGSRAADVAVQAEAAAADPALGEAELRSTLAGAAAQLRRLLRKLEKVIAISDVYQERLRSAQRTVQQLQELFLPICMFCKRVRDDDEYWDKIESYFARHAAVSFSHGICPACMEQHYGDGALVEAPTPQAVTARPAPRVSAAEQRLISQLVAIAAHPAIAAAGSAAALLDVVARCERTFASYRKALEISDGYQSEFQARLSAAARVDGLTGLATRTAAMDVLESLRNGPEAMANSAWLILADVDGMSGLNVRAGYEAGDRLLIAVGRGLRTTCPHARMRARWGGDAFAVLGVSDRRRAQAMADAIVAAVRNLKIAGRDTLRVTASVGLASIQGPGVDSWIAAAEAALREAKRQGDRAVARAR